MFRSLCLLAFFSLLLLVLLAPGLNPPGRTASALNIPVRFEPNLGQAPSGVHFWGRAASYDLLLRDSDALLSPRRDTGSRPLRLRWNSAATAKPTAVKPRRGVSNYLIGADPARWKTGVPHFDEVLYAGAFPGIDLAFYGAGPRVEFDLRVQPHASTSPIEFFWDGADSLSLDSNGDLLLVSGRERFRQHKPVAYQLIAGHRRDVPASYRLDGNRVRLDIGSYDASHSLTIDPVLSYSTYTGYSGNDAGYAIAVDSQGNAYFTGYTSSPDFAVTPGAFQSQLRALDAGVFKLNPDTNEIVFATYFGGTSSEYGYGIAVAPDGSVLLTGSTSSNNLPVTGSAFQRTFGGVQDCFVARLAPGGDSLIYSTYLGGSASDYCNAITLDADNNAYVAGTTSSVNFPTLSAFQTNNRGSNDIFAAKLNPQGSALLYSTYIGGTGNETALGIHIDAAGRAHLAGNSTSSDFPTVDPIQSELKGPQDVIVAKLSADGKALLFSTFLGGEGADTANAIRVHSDGSVYVTGLARTADFPLTEGAFQTAFGGYFDSFVARLAPDGRSLLFSTLLGGRLRENSFGLDLDSDGNAYICGFTTSPDFPRAEPVQDSIRGAREAMHLTSDASISWAPSAQGLNVDNVLAISATADGSTVYASTWGYGVFRSTDGGDSWSPAGMDSSLVTIGPLAVDPKNANRVIAGSSTGLYRTDDGGATWNPTSIVTGSVAAIVFDPNETDIVYASVAGRGVVKSTDGGATWTTSNTGLNTTTVNALAIDPSNPRTLYAGTTSSVYKTTDAARTWTLPPSFIAANVTKLAVSPQSPNIVWAGTNGGGLRRSDNGGQFWNIGSLYGKTVTALAVHPTRPGTVYAAVNQEGVYRSHDSGITLLPADPPPSLYINTLWLDPSRPDRLLAGSMATPEAYVAKLSPDGSSLLFSSFFGGPGNDGARAIALSRARKIYITGNTDGDGFPVTPNAIPPLGSGRANGFLSVFTQ